jgi:hypothetical protein
LLWIRNKKDIPKHDNPFYWAGVDEIPGNSRVSSTNRFFRRVISYSITIVIIGASATVVYFIEYP